MRQQFILLFILALALCSPIHLGAQVSLSNAWNASTSAALSHTVGAGSNRLLVYVISFEDDDNLNDVTSVSYGGRAMTQAAQSTTITGTGSQSRAEIWYLNEAGILLASNTTFTPGFSISNPATSHGYYAMAVTLSGVNQVTPICSSGTGQRLTSSTVNLSAGITVLPGELMIYGTHTGDSRTHTPAGGYTESIDLNGAGGGQSASINHKLIVTAGTENPTSTLNASGNRFIMAAVRVLPFGATCSSALPIELSAFTLEQEKNMINLYWQTASEKNNQWFIVQRSSNGKDWENLLRIEGAVNSSSVKNYKAEDSHPLIGTSYYRLKQIDTGGQFSYSGIESINFAEQLNAELKLYPNPCRSELFLSSATCSFENLLVMNVFGEPVPMTITALSKGNFLLDIKELPSGYYLVRVGGQAGWFIKE